MVVLWVWSSTPENVPSPFDLAAVLTVYTIGVALKMHSLKFSRVVFLA